MEDGRIRFCHIMYSPLANMLSENYEFPIIILFIRTHHYRIRPIFAFMFREIGFMPLSFYGLDLPLFFRYTLCNFQGLYQYSIMEEFHFGRIVTMS